MLFWIRFSCFFYVIKYSQKNLVTIKETFLFVLIFYKQWNYDDVINYGSEYRKCHKNDGKRSSKKDLVLFATNLTKKIPDCSKGKQYYELFLKSKA